LLATIQVRLFLLSSVMISIEDFVVEAIQKGVEEVSKVDAGQCLRSLIVIVLIAVFLQMTGLSLPLRYVLL